MVGAPVPLGPFIGGLNNRTDDSTIDDTELMEAINWQMGLDGTLISRPPIWEHTPVFGVVNDIADDFNRADGAVGISSSGDAWVTQGAPVVASNQLNLPATDDRILFDADDEDIVLEVDWITGGPDIILRYSDDDNYIFINSLYIGKFVAGTHTPPDLTDPADNQFYSNGMETGMHLKVVASGDNIKLIVTGDPSSDGPIITNHHIADVSGTIYGAWNPSWYAFSPTNTKLDNITMGHFNPNTPHTGERLKILGWMPFHDSGTFTNVMFASNSTGTWAYYGGSWYKISDNEYDAFVTYGKVNNKAFFPAKGDTNGGWWDLDESVIDTQTDFPIGQSICVYKERLWVAADLATRPSRMYYSIINPVGENPDWDQVFNGPHDDGPDNLAPAGYVDVNPGDGQRIQAIVAYDDSVVIFKDDSTYIFAYDGPIAQGRLQAVSQEIGVSDPRAITLYKGILYTYHEGNVYAYSQGQFQSITTKFLPMGDSSLSGSFTEPLSLSNFGDNLILRQYDKVYTYHFLTGAWTEWQSDFPIGEFHIYPTNIGQEDNTYYVASVDDDTTKIFRINSVWNDVNTEDYICSVVTKTYDFGTERNFKRLFWWGIDCEAAAGELSAFVTPINSLFTATWDDIASGGAIWDDFLTVTWDSLIPSQPSIPDGPITEYSTRRRFYKCLKSLRFHQINFGVAITTDGSNTNGRLKLFDIVPFVGIKEKVRDKVT